MTWPRFELQSAAWEDSTIQIHPLASDLSEKGVIGD